MSAMTVLENIADYVRNLNIGSIPTDVIAKMKILTMHHLYTGFAGLNEDDSKIALRILNKQFRDSGKSTVLGESGKKHSSIGASFVNAVLMHSVQMEDTCKGLHPGPHTIPAAFALGEDRNVDGADVLAALVAGYETNIQVGDALMKYSGPRGWRGTTIYGILGAASTASRVLDLDQPRTVNALAYSTNLASGLMECWLAGTSEWLFTSGIAVQNGVVSALIAEEGGEGAATSLEGLKGFIGTYCGKDSIDYRSIDSGLGKRYSIPEVSLKPYSVITTILPIIHNVVTLVKQDNIEHHEVKSIRITAGQRVTSGPLRESILDFGPYTNKTQAYKSLPCATGIGIVHGGVAPETVVNYQDPSVARVAAKVEVMTEPSLEGFYNLVEIRTSDNVLHTIEGNEFPSLSDDRVISNLRIMASCCVSREKAENLISLISRMERVSMSDISDCLS